jgi:hypothetical protein
MDRLPPGDLKPACAGLITGPNGSAVLDAVHLPALQVRDPLPGSVKPAVHTIVENT